MVYIETYDCYENIKNSDLQLAHYNHDTLENFN